MTTERERMLAGEFYNSRDPELLALAHRARALLARFHATPSTDAEGRAGQFQKTFFVYPDPDVVDGFPLDLGTSGESSPILADLESKLHPVRKKQKQGRRGKAA